MKIFADLDVKNIALGIKRVNDNYVNPGNSIELPNYDESILGRVYKGNGEFYPRLTIATDKTQITANGVDTATITVTVQDTISPHAISFTVNNGTPVVANTANGVATLSITTTVSGDYTVTATSDIYGTNSVTVKGV